MTLLNATIDTAEDLSRASKLEAEDSVVDITGPGPTGPGQALISTSVTEAQWQPALKVEPGARLPDIPDTVDAVEDLGHDEYRVRVQGNSPLNGQTKVLWEPVGMVYKTYGYVTREGGSISGKLDLKSATLNADVNRVYFFTNDQDEYVMGVNNSSLADKPYDITIYWKAIPAPEPEPEPEPEPDPQP